MIDKVFVDTNILIYAHDRDAGKKHLRAQELVSALWDSGAGVISTQVLQEFYVNITRKIPSPVSRKLARDLVQIYGSWHTQTISIEHIQNASEIEERYKISFWDALIVASASEAGATKLFSEDLNPGQKIAGVYIENPFR